MRGLVKRARQPPITPDWSCARIAVIGAVLAVIGLVLRSTRFAIDAGRVERCLPTSAVDPEGDLPAQPGLALRSAMRAWLGYS